MEPQKSDSMRQQLVKRRGFIKSQITIFNKYLLDWKPEVGVKTLQLRVEKINKLWNEFQNIQFELLEYDEEAAIIKESQNFEKSFFSVLEVANDLVEKNQTRLTSETKENVNLSKIQLPKIELVKFAGDISNWINFSAVFKTLIIDNRELTDVKRLCYLKSSLQGLPAQLIASLSLTDQNFNVAWQILKTRYENKPLLSMTLVAELFQIKKLEIASASTLRSLSDHFQKNVSALEALNHPVKHWDLLLIHLISSKLDYPSRKAWEHQTKPDVIPSYKQMSEFLLQRCYVLERLENDSQAKSQSKNSISTKKVSPRHTIVTTVEKCSVCKLEQHPLFKCEAFKNMSVPQKTECVKKLKLCFNCLKRGHGVKDCKGSLCRICSRKHNSLLHPTIDQSAHISKEQTSDVNIASPLSQSSSEASASHAILTQLAHVNLQNDQKQVLLATAIVKVAAADGTWIEARCLLDMASQSNIICADLAKKLNLHQTNSQVSVLGINCKINQAVISVRTSVASRISKKLYNEKLTFLVLPKITGLIPTVNVQTSHFNIPDDIMLADPNYSMPSQVDILLGAEVFWKILQPSVLTLGTSKPTLRYTSLGWVCTGTLPSEADVSSESICNLCAIDALQTSLQHFWEIENICGDAENQTFELNPEQERCEEIFRKHVTRDHDGRFSVPLPFREDTIELGQSRHIALNKLYALENRLHKNPKLLGAYSAFFDEYRNLGHMTPIQSTEISEPNYYIPHFEVIRESSHSTPLRIVFNASQKSSNKKSLNDLLLAGPKTQSDLREILLRFRLHKYVIAGDITKFYRQVNVLPQHRKFQLVQWRSSRSDPIQTFQLNTVTYGVTSAPYLATRCLNLLFEIEQNNFPSIKNENMNFYVDDYLSGSDDLATVVQLRQQITAILTNGGFSICKWRSNDSTVLQSIPLSNQAVSLSLIFNDTQPASALGMKWHTNTDHFEFHPNIQANSYTKRNILSNICKLWDPLGLLGPKICIAKLIMQKMWADGNDWDVVPSQEVINDWIKFVTDLQHLKHLNIPRCLSRIENIDSREIHCFADASTRAYGACCYLITYYSNRSTTSRLMMSKHKVVPLKTPQSRTLPQLELCAASLAIKLGMFVSSALRNFQIVQHFWSDSQIVLAWLGNPHDKLPTFVRNRVAHILQHSTIRQWKHVQSQHNPADLLTRGSTIKNLLHSSQWWTGPSWLTLPQQQWPNCSIPKGQTQEPTIILTNVKQTNLLADLLERFSSFDKLLKVICCYKKFIRWIVSKSCQNLFSPQDYLEARHWIFKQVQKQAFAVELKCLNQGELVPKQSPLNNLAPFLDERGLIRVGGRLHASQLNFTQKHPIALPNNHSLTRMYIKREHERHFHANPQMLIGILRQTVWILKIRKAVRSVIAKCIRCFKCNPSQASQIMGDLPADRVKVNHPFAITGIDFCGPFFIKSGFRKNASVSKAYVSVFVCFATRAIHLEVVEDLSTLAFIQALRRFIARRGCPSKIWSDNATNFKGAANMMKDVTILFRSSSFLQQIDDFAWKQNIQWHWISPNSPHQGGLWEAAVKQFKTCIKKVIQQSPFTYPQLTTLVCQIEACLNSRPLVSFSDDPSDLTALTPAHFLIHRSLLAPPLPLVSDSPEDIHSLWESVSANYQRFWKIWSVQYLHSLQVRSKWTRPQRNLQVGDLVLLVDKHNPPLYWKLARVSKTFPDHRGHNRVAEVVTSQGTFVRSVQQLAPLPTCQSSNIGTGGRDVRSPDRNK